MPELASVREAERQWFSPVRDYDLGLTLTSGQAFRWRFSQGWWQGVIGHRWVQVRQQATGLEAHTAVPVDDWTWLEDYLQVRVNLQAVLATFPNDPELQAAVAANRGLRLLRQEPWECLASFIISSTKQITQIQQIVAALCARFGEPVIVPPGHEPAFAFPSAERLAGLSEPDLRACKMGFRAPYLLAAARAVSRGEVALARLGDQPVEEARAALMRLPGVGEKIANCVLLFAYGFQEAFPVDVWVRRALRQMYFPRRQPTPDQLAQFTRTHFGPFAGYAQQYLFCYMRNRWTDQRVRAERARRPATETIQTDGGRPRRAGRLCQPGEKAHPAVPNAGNGVAPVAERQASAGRRTRQASGRRSPSRPDRSGSVRGKSREPAA